MWSRLKKSVEDRICEELAGRVELHVTRYRKEYGFEGRWWITLDGEKIFSGYTRRDGGSYWEVSTSIGHAAEGGGAPGEPPIHAVEREDLQGRNAADQFTSALAAYLDLSIDDALRSDDPIIRSLAMIDRRLGKRRLRTMLLGEHEHPLVRYLFELRCEVEGVRREA